MKRIESCLICGEDLEYFQTEREMECSSCHRKFMSKSACKNGHYVCDECHSATAIKNIVETCAHSDSKNPVEIAFLLMNDPYVYMYGPESHVLVGCALLTAYKNAGGNIELGSSLREMVARGRKVPGGVCGFWGCCGAAISAGMFYSIASGATPLTKDSWGKANLMTSNALNAIGTIGGPRCCKRNAFLAIRQAVAFTAEHLGVRMEMPERIICTFSLKNKQCIGTRCPFNPHTIQVKALPKVAFVCVHNSCRSQIAEALGKHLAGGIFESFSAGTETKPQINQDAVRLMRQLYGIDMEKTQYSKLLSELPDVDRVVTMGCNVQCPHMKCSQREDWGLEDPTGKSDDEFIAVIKVIETNIIQLRNEYTSC